MWESSPWTSNATFSNSVVRFCLFSSLSLSFFFPVEGSAFTYDDLDGETIVSLFISCSWALYLKMVKLRFVKTNAFIFAVNTQLKFKSHPRCFTCPEGSCLISEMGSSGVEDLWQGETLYPFSYGGYLEPFGVLVIGVWVRLVLHSLSVGCPWVRMDVSTVKAIWGFLAKS